jgi:protein SCO1/2
MTLRHPFLVAALALGALACGALLWLDHQPVAVTPQPQGESPAELGRLPAFHLTRADGRAITQADVLGKPTLLYFGYTFCPDVCPTELGWVARVLRVLGPDADRVNVLFVSVDPPRDTPQVLAAYVPLFHERIQGATGTPQAIADFAKALGVVYRQADVDTADPGFYLVDHSSTVFFFGKNGALVGKFGSTMRTDITAALIRQQL